MELTPDLLLETLIRTLDLMRHYANLLNMHDGGHRQIPKSVITWIMRVNYVGNLESPDDGDEVTLP